jgi:hypothetical protein
MKYIHVLIIVLFSAVVFISCSKNNNPDNSTNTTDDNYLSRYYFLYDDGSGTAVLEGSTSYSYDNLKRVTIMLDSTIYNSSGNLLPFSRAEYFYNGNDLLPYKAVTTTHPDSNPEYDTLVSFYTYNSAGKVIADSTLSATHSSGYDYYTKFIRSYQYNGSTATSSVVVTTTNSGGTSTSTMSDNAQLDQNGNITQNTKNRGTDVIQSTITWDNKPSPFAKLSNFQTFAIFPSGETFFYEMPKTNNRLHITETTTGSSPHFYEEDFTNKFTYNADGYPVQILDNDPTTPGAYSKVIFEYRSF